MGRRTALAPKAAEAALGALLFIAPLLLGGAPAWALWPTCALAGGSLVLAAAAATSQRHSLRVPLATALPLGVAALCLLQLLPLPPWLLGLVSPRAAEVRDFVLQPLGLDGWRPVSLDPPATWRELAKHLGYAAALVSAAEVARSRRARVRLLATLALSGALVAAIGIGHKVANAQAVFGLYGFQAAVPPIVTPFGNPNHLAAFLTLSGVVTLGFVSRSPGPRAGWLLAFVAQAAVAFLSLSRGGVVFFAFAQVAFGAALLLRERPRRALYAALASVGAAAVGGAVAMDRLWAEFAAGGSKTALWPMFGSAASKFWLTGMGRGAFETAFPRFQTEWATFTLNYPENVVLQLWAELGLPAALALLALAAVVWVRAASRKDLWTAELAGLCGLLALGAHELFDFSLELMPTALLASALLGVLARAPDAADTPAPAEEEAPRRGVGFLGRVIGPARDLRLLGPRATWAAGLTAAAMVLALALGRDTAAAAETRLQAALASEKDPAAIRARSLRAIDAHPADPLLPALAGQACARARAPSDALAFVNRALFLRPLDGPSHRIAARALLELGKRGQAFLEYRLAVEGGDVGALREALARAKAVDELARLCPDDAATAEDAVDLLIRAGRPDDAMGLAEAMAERLPPKAGASRVWAKLVSLRVSRGDLEGAKRALDALTALEPEGARMAMARASYLRATGDGPGAIAVLQEESLREPGHTELGFALVEQLLAAQQTRAARDVLARIAPFLSHPPDRARMFSCQGRAFEQERRFAKALEAYQTASRLMPDHAGLHYDVARMHEVHHQPGAAAQEVLAGMRVDAPAAAAAQRTWADRLLAEERSQLLHQAERDQKDHDSQIIQQKVLGTDADGADAVTP
ncbi:MAG TPA: O-antigen ligase family protein [Myxococcaceae bacterium]|nr:O-antigen ligase family protein [Myxococcaceae bacterium]